MFFFTFKCAAGGNATSSSANPTLANANLMFEVVPPCYN